MAETKRPGRNPQGVPYDGATAFAQGWGPRHNPYRKRARGPELTPYQTVSYRLWTAEWDVANALAFRSHVFGCADDPDGALMGAARVAPAGTAPPTN